MTIFSGIRKKTGCLLAAMAFFTATPVFAQGAPAAAVKIPPSIAVVDVDAVMQGSVAAKSIRDQIDRYQQTFREELAKEENKLRTRQQDLQKQAAKLTPDQMAAKAQAFDKEVAEFRMKAEQRSRALDRSYGLAMEKLTQAMVEVVRDIATQRGDNMVLPRTQVLLYEESMNVTQMVLEGLNKKMPNVTVEKPKLETAAPAAAAARPQGAKP